MLFLIHVNCHTLISMSQVGPFALVVNGLNLRNLVILKIPAWSQCGHSRENKQCKRIINSKQARKKPIRISRGKLKFVDKINKSSEVEETILIARSK